MFTTASVFRRGDVDGPLSRTNATDRNGTCTVFGRTAAQEAGMSDPRLHSLHLEGQPRRDSFRAARQALQAACGSQTLIGDPPPLDDVCLHAPTLAAPAGG